MASPLINSKKKITDLTGQGLTNIDTVTDVDHSTTLILDGNKISDLASLAAFTSLEKLSLKRNYVVKMEGLSSLFKLRVLNLQDNGIEVIEGLPRLAQLEWLSLAGNKIKVIQNFKANIMLKHLDLSDNFITDLGNLSSLIHLKTLLLESNILNSLKSLQSFLPPSLSILGLAENQLADLTEVQLLACLPFLEELSLFGNPCLLGGGEYIDYRPYVICCCKNLVTLDGTTVTQANRHSVRIQDAEGHLKMLQPGQHSKLAKYLLESSPGYSPKIHKKDAAMAKETDAPETDTSLLESESVYLPVMIDSPPKNKRPRFQESRPFTAPPSFDMRGITWKDLISSEQNEDVTRRHDEYAAEEHGQEEDVICQSDNMHNQSEKGDFIPQLENARPKTAPYSNDFVYREQAEREAGVYSDIENETDELTLTSKIGYNTTQAATEAVELTDTETVQSSVSMTAEEAIRLLNLAAAMIQAYVRGFIQRKIYQGFLKSHRAARRIQAAC